jgi:hypothetical protein
LPLGDERDLDQVEDYEIEDLSKEDPEASHRGLDPQPDDAFLLAMSVPQQSRRPDWGPPRGY